MKEYIILLAVLAAAFIACLFALNHWYDRFAKDEAKREAISKAKDLCEKLLTQVTLALFTEAERKFGDGTGKLKMSYVLERFLALLPDWVQELIDPVWLADKLEMLLDKAEEEWKANPRLIGKEKNTELLGERINDSFEESTID